MSWAMSGTTRKSWIRSGWSTSILRGGILRTRRDCWRATRVLTVIFRQFWWRPILRRRTSRRPMSCCSRWRAVRWSRIPSRITPVCSARWRRGISRWPRPFSIGYPTKMWFRIRRTSRGCLRSASIRRPFWYTRVTTRVLSRIWTKFTLILCWTDCVRTSSSTTRSSSS